MLSKYAQIGGTPHGENIAVAGEQPMFTDSYCMCKARCVYILCSILVLVYIVTVGCNPHPHNPFTPTPTPPHSFHLLTILLPHAHHICADLEGRGCRGEIAYTSSSGCADIKRGESGEGTIKRDNVCGGCGGVRGCLADTSSAVDVLT